MGQSAVVSCVCVCGLMLLFSLVFCPFKTKYKFARRLLNELKT